MALRVTTGWHHHPLRDACLASGRLVADTDLCRQQCRQGDKPKARPPGSQSGCGGVIQWREGHLVGEVIYYSEEVFSSRGTRQLLSVLKCN